MKRQAGFTIIELMIATVFFAMILLICTSGLIYIGQSYYKGVTSQATQEVTRTVVDQLRGDFAYSSSRFVLLADNGANKGFCVGNKKYSYQLAKQIPFNGSGHALIVREAPNCAAESPDDVDDTSLPTPPSELLGAGMSLYRLDVASNDDGESASIDITIVSGDITGANSVLDANGNCLNGIVSKFCATSSLSTYITRRLK